MGALAAMFGMPEMQQQLQPDVAPQFAIPAQMPMQRQQPMQQPIQQANPSIDPATISQRIQEILGAKTANEPGMIENYLSGRFQPQRMGDTADAIIKSAPLNAGIVTGGEVYNNRISQGLNTIAELQKLSGNDRTPAALQLTNAYEQAIQSGDVERAKRIAAFAKIQGGYAPTQVGGGQVNTGDPLLQPKPLKPLPPTALKMQQEQLDDLQAAETTQSDLAEFKRKIDTGELPLGPMLNPVGAGMNYMGWSTPQTRNQASFKSNLERLRNESLRLNKGVQTEGDSQRAWNELITNINDPELVKQRLEEIINQNERAAKLKKLNIDALRSNFGYDPFDFSQMENLPSAYGNNTRQPQNSVAPQGNRIRVITPDGRTGTVDSSHLQELLNAGGKVAQ